MYIKLGTIRANRYYDNPDDFIILSEVPSSSMSYESPVIVRSLDELNIWFGKSFSDYNYLRELIEMGVSLYLYGPTPVSTTSLDYVDRYIDEENHPYPSINYLKEYISGEEKIRYISEDGNWVYYSGEWVREEDIIFSEPEDNRDTLVISESGKVCHPRDINEVPEKIIDIDYSESTDEGHYVFRISWSGEELRDGEYLGYRSDNSWTIYYKGEGKILEKIKSKLGERNVEYKNIKNFQDLINLLSKDYTLTSKVSDTEYLLYSKERRDLIEMNSFSSIELSVAQEEEDNLIFSNLSNEGYISFESKTIGRDPDEYNLSESRISVSIEDALEDGYIVRISRYGYSEYYIGHLKGNLGEEGLLDKINRESKLLYCEHSDGLEKLPLGFFYLSGAKVKETSAEGYIRSMDKLLGDTLEDSVVPDFFMIPNLSLYGERRDEKLFLPYATAGEFQYLIGETGEEYLKNYLGDKENRLLYFYGNIQYRRQPRPAYYLYLRGLLENNNQSLYKYSDIVYNPPSNIGIEYRSETMYLHNPYITEGVLEEYKCNYLVSNNQYYYYNKYQDGKDYESSGILRFIIGKVYREIQKHRWEIIGQKFNTLTENKINEIVQRVSVFSNVKSIQVVGYIPYPDLETLDIEVDIWTRELLKNNITLDITINYKKYGN